MKTLVFAIIAFLSLSNFSYAKEVPERQSKERFKVRLYVSYLTSISGTVDIYEDKLSFTPTETNNIIEKSLYSLPSNSFKELNFDFKDIKGIYKRNTFLIFPNNFLLKTKDGKKYKFYSYKRKKVLSVFKKYQKENP